MLSTKHETENHSTTIEEEEEEEEDIRSSSSAQIWPMSTGVIFPIHYQIFSYKEIQELQ